MEALVATDSTSWSLADVDESLLTPDQFLALTNTKSSSVDSQQLHPFLQRCYSVCSQNETTQQSTNILLDPNLNSYTSLSSGGGDFVYGTDCYYVIR